MSVERALWPPSRPPPVSAGASRWEGLAIDYEALSADGSLPCERWKMSGRGRAGLLRCARRLRVWRPAGVMQNERLAFRPLPIL